ncbi:MAG: hypothetical protein WCD89_18715 [Anaerocolumna sp.]
MQHNKSSRHIGLWEGKYLFENYNLAKECLSRYGYDQESVNDTIRCFRISSNAIYPFNEFKSMYNGIELAPLRIQYKDFAVW